MDLVFDLTIMVMLLVTIVYAWRLNAKLNTIRGHKAQLKANIQAFHDATKDAVKAVKDLQVKGQNVCKDIDDKIKKASLAADEIDILIASANKKLSETKAHISESRVQEPRMHETTGFDDLLEEPYSSNFSVSSMRRKLNRNSHQGATKKFNSINEAELAKALREKQFRDALVS